jgi:anti-sigma regulatory factor (Ser/Thr protein kinase)
MQKIKINATLKELPLVTDFIEEICDEMDVTPKDSYSIMLIVEELVTNVCKHSYPEGSGTLEVTIDHHETYCTLIFTDSGIPFNPTQVPAPNTKLSLDERQIGGLGIFFVRQNSDEFHYSRQNGQNIVTIIKKFKK